MPIVIIIKIPIIIIFSESIPGTKWCGAGTSALALREFGILKNVDKCCKQHDKCENGGTWRNISYV